MNEQQILDFFNDKGGWFSKLPQPYEELNSGHAHLFTDTRLIWFWACTEVYGKHVLELGPLEAAHTFMMHRAGAASITAIESNLNAFLKCLVVKELFDLHTAHFHFGDCLQYFPALPRFDICVASGVLYHQTDPVELLAQISRHCRCLYLWTHVYNGDHPALKDRAVEADHYSNYGFDCTTYAIAYQNFPHIGGTEPFARWMSREDLFRCLEYFGLRVRAVNFDEPDHPNGPALALIAHKED